MATKDDVVRKFRELLGTKQDTLVIDLALTGDGSSATTYDVDGKVGFAWVRLWENQSKVLQVVTDYPGWPQDVTVLIGKKYPSDSFKSILGVNKNLYRWNQTPDQSAMFALPVHGHTHHAVSGHDPAYMDIRNLLPARVRQTDVASLSVYAEALSYSWAGARQEFGGAAIDLTAHVPATASYHRYVLVYLDAATNSLLATAGPTVPLAVTPDVPAVTLGTIPLALVRMYQGQTTIVEADIDDYRPLFAVEGGGALDALDLVAHLEAEFDLLMSRHAVEGV